MTQHNLDYDYDDVNDTPADQTVVGPAATDDHEATDHNDMENHDATEHSFAGAESNLDYEEGMEEVSIGRSDIHRLGGS